MSEQDRNVALMHEAWGRWESTKGADLSIWDDYMAEDFKLFSLSDGSAEVPFTVARNGLQELKEYLEGLTNAFAMDHWKIVETIAQGDRVVGIGTTGWKNKATGKAFVTPIVIVTRWRDGRICEYSEYYDTARVAASTK